MSDDSPQTATEAGEALLAVLRTHVEAIAAHGIRSEADEELDSRLWEAVGAYGDALDEFDEDDEADDAAEPDELRFTVRTRYDYTVLDEKSFLSGGKGIGAAVLSLLERAGGKPLSALEVRLDPDMFIRVHRSVIVRRDCVAAIGRSPSRAPVLRLRSGEQIRVGRSYAAQLAALRL